jgi:hypothetical protein
MGKDAKKCSSKNEKGYLETRITELIKINKVA